MDDWPSEAVMFTLNVPETVVPAGGEAIDTDGGVVSGAITLNTVVALVPVFERLSVACA